MHQRMLIVAKGRERVAAGLKPESPIGSPAWFISETAVRWCCDLVGRDAVVLIERELGYRIANAVLGIARQC